MKSWVYSIYVPLQHPEFGHLRGIISKIVIKSNCNAITADGTDSDALSGLSRLILVCEKVFPKNRNYFTLFRLQPTLMRIESVRSAITCLVKPLL
jgi:hypothetical protein